MSCYLTYSSPYFAHLNLGTQDASRITALIHSATSFVEKYCNRKFVMDSYVDTVTVQQDGSIIIPNPPISAITRLCAATGNWLTIQNTNTLYPYASYSASDSEFLLHYTFEGARHNISYAYEQYEDLNSIYAAVNELGNGWSASITEGYGNYPAADLVLQHGSCKNLATLTHWEELDSPISFKRDTGIVDGFGGADWLVGRPNICSPLIPYQQLRIEYVGGFADCEFPDDIKETTANLVCTAFNNPEGKAQSVTLGGQYAYTLFSDSMLTKSDARVLNHYRLARA